jgi:RNA polymerase sigma factor (sigma-70 family)
LIDLPQLCVRIHAGDQQASETLVMLLRPRLFHHLAPRLGEDAQDAFQEVCAATVRAIQNNRIEHPQFVLAYAHAISERVKARFLEERAKAMGRLISMDDSERPLHKAIPATQESDVIKEDHLRIIWGARKSLPGIDQEIIQRACFEDQDHSTIAEALGLTVHQLSVRKTRAIAFLKAEYERLTRRTELMAA